MAAAPKGHARESQRQHSRPSHETFNGHRQRALTRCSPIPFAASPPTCISNRPRPSLGYRQPHPSSPKPKKQKKSEGKEPETWERLSTARGCLRPRTWLAAPNDQPQASGQANPASNPASNLGASEGGENLHVGGRPSLARAHTHVFSRACIPLPAMTCLPSSTRTRECLPASAGGSLSFVSFGTDSALDGVIQPKDSVTSNQQVLTVSPQLAPPTKAQVPPLLEERMLRTLPRLERRTHSTNNNTTTGHGSERFPSAASRSRSESVPSRLSRRLSHHRRKPSKNHTIMEEMPRVAENGPRMSRLPHIFFSTSTHIFFGGPRRATRKVDHLPRLFIRRQPVAMAACLCRHTHGRGGCDHRGVPRPG